MELSTWVWFVLASICLFYVLIKTSAHSRSSSIKLPPGPNPLPIVGSLFKLGNKPHESLAQLANVYGPIISLKLGSTTTVVVSSPSMAKEVLQKHDQTLSSRTIVDAVTALNHHESSVAWLPAYNLTWRYIRKISNSHVFSNAKLDASKDLRRQKLNELVDYVRQRAVSGRAVDVGQVAFTTALNLISNVVFSIDLVSLHSSESVHDFSTAFRGIMDDAGKPNFTDYFPILRSLDPQGIRRRMTTYFRKLDVLFEEIIKRRLQSAELQSSNDLLSTLLNLSQNGSSELGRPVIISFLTDMFVAGTDTTSSTAEWAMAELLYHPYALEKAQAEVRTIIGMNRQVEELDIAQLPYLQAVVKETYRLHPPVPLLLPRKAENEVEISGFTIPKHARVMVNAWAIGRDHNAWTDPTMFKPERFLESEISFKGQDFELIPFGAGRRICPGLPLAHRMLHLMLAMLLQSFDWKLENGMKPEDLDMQERFGLTLQKAEPLRLVPTLA